MKNIYLVTGIAFLAYVAGIAFGDVGNTIEAKTYVWSMWNALTIVFIFSFMYFFGFIAGRKSNEE